MHMFKYDFDIMTRFGFGSSASWIRLLECQLNSFALELVVCGTGLLSDDGMEENHNNN